MAEGPALVLQPVAPEERREFGERLAEYWADLGVIPPSAWHRRYLARLWEEDGQGRHAWWGMAGTRRLGFAVLRLDADWVEPERRVGYVAEFSIFAPWRRLGHGGRLFAAVRAWFLVQGCSGIELDVLPTNLRAQAFWSAQGFRPAYQHLRLDGGGMRL